MDGQLIVELQPLESIATKRSTILIVEDDVDQVDLLEHGLNQQGFHVLSATRGSRGWQLARQELPDVVLLDLSLPDIDGLELCERLVDTPQTAHIPIIVVSGCDHDDIVRRCRAAGGRFFIRKPYDPNALLLLINQAIDQRGKWWPND